MNNIHKYNACRHCAGLLLPAFVALCAHTAPATAQAPSTDASTDRSTRARGGEYSVINLGPDAGVAILNQRGQAAFGTYTSDAILNGFFDGRRVHTLGTLGGMWTWVRGLNNHGVVVGESQDAATPFPNTFAFSWSVARGIRPLPGPPGATAYAINDQNQAVGLVQAPGAYARANRWNPDGSLTSLGPLPMVSSVAYAINDSGMASGISDNNPNGELHATVWDELGAATDLSPKPGTQTFAEHLNAKGQVAGAMVSDLRVVGFFWSRQQGLVRIGPDGGGVQSLSALNDHGDVTGNNQIYDNNPGLRYTPFIWSARRGLRPLPLAGAAHGNVTDLNNRREMVGFIDPGSDDWRNRRAVLWNGETSPVDLNTRLYRAPAGLKLYAARALNDNGAILADSNAGLVMLRPGREGWDAPVLGPILGTGFDDVVAFNATADFTVGFVDSGAQETHVATASVNDDCPQSAPNLRQVRGTGEVNLRHTFCRAGTFTVKVKVTDCAGNATEVRRSVFVTDPATPTLIGQGTLAPAAAPAATTATTATTAARPDKTPLRFAVWAPLDGRATARSAGSVEVSGPFHFRAETVGKPERSGQSIRLAGSGRYNGRAGYRFQLDAGVADGQRGGADRMRLRISHIDPASKTEVVDFDNGADALPARNASLARTASASVGTPATPATLVTQGRLQLKQ